LAVLRPGNGSVVGQKVLALPYYSQHAVFASLRALFSLKLYPVRPTSELCKFREKDALLKLAMQTFMICTQNVHLRYIVAIKLVDELVTPAVCGSLLARNGPRGISVADNFLQLLRIFFFATFCLHCLNDLMTFSYALKYITFVSVTGMHSKRCSGLIFLSALLFCTFPVESCLHRCTINEDVCKYLRVYFLTGFVIFC